MISYKKYFFGCNLLTFTEFHSIIIKHHRYGGIAQLARVLGSYPIGRWFKSYCRYHKGPLVKRLRHRPFTAESWVQFPYGSPQHMLGNSVNTLFPSFLFTLKRLLSFTCPLYGFGLSFGIVAIIRLLEIQHRSNRFTCPCLCLIKYMAVDRSRGCDC